jgi:deazaflavin-dependent oxidoreductase (nitroreductase family)
MYLKPSPVERIFNRAFGLMVRLGIGLPHNYLLQVRGRKTGRIYSAPVDVLDMNGRRYLVSGRGQTLWVRNALAAGQVVLAKGSRQMNFSVRAVPDDEKPPILKAYVERFKLTVQRYFPIPAGSPATDFAPIAERYPVFELLPRADNSAP